MAARVIAHIDLDAFFASVEQRDNPSLKGKPVVIGADPKEGKGRGVVSTCSYEARKFGIHSAMPISIAYRKCPRAVFLPPDGRKYSLVSDAVFKIVYDFTPDIEPISIDEAFLDLTGSYHLWGSPKDACAKLRARIREEIGLTASVGIAPVKMAAKIASDLCKPDGLLEVLPAGLVDFLRPLPIEKLWGVGPKTREALNSDGVRTIGDIADLPLEDLTARYGEHGRHLHELANGVDPRPVEASEEVKSVSQEHTFDVDTAERERIFKVMLFLSEKLSRRLRQEDLKGKTVTLKIRLSGFKTYTRARTLPQRTNFTDAVYSCARELFDEFYQKGMKVRLIGVRVSNFEDDYVQDSLFRDPASERMEAVHQVVDKIKDKFGEKSIHRAI